MDIYSSEDSDGSSPPYHSDRFNAWLFLHSLIYYGPDFFRRFKAQLGKPETIEQILIVKTQQVPMRAMDINPSTVNGDADVLTELFRQMGVGDPKEEGQEHVVDIGNHVILVHGDLGMGEKIDSLQISRSVEKTPSQWLQQVIFIPGLFHLKMACANALWRIFIQPKESQNNPNSLLSHIGQIRPNETLKFASGPGFRRMHEVIQHVGIVSRLECWHAKLKQCPEKFQDLESFAKSGPGWELLQKLAHELAMEFIAGKNLPELRERPQSERDIDLENLLLHQKYFMLYEEITYAMNTGEIGRIEACFMSWVFIFRSCGKHKYATYMMKYLHNVHFVYPKGLQYVFSLLDIFRPINSITI